MLSFTRETALKIRNIPLFRGAASRENLAQDVVLYSYVSRVLNCSKQANVGYRKLRKLLSVVSTGSVKSRRRSQPGEGTADDL